MPINYIVVRTNPDYQYDDVLTTINNNFSSVTTSFLSTTGGTIIGNLIISGAISGGTFYGDGSNLTGISGGSGYNYYTTAATLVGQTVFFDRNDQLSAYTVDLSSLIITGGTDYYITGATFNKSTSEMTLTRNDGGSVLASGMTDFYTTGGTLIDTVIYFDRIDSISAYSISLSGLVSGITTSGNYLPTSGGTVTGNTYFSQNLSATTMWSYNDPWTIELIEATTANFYAPYQMSINSYTNILGSPTITLKDDGIAYTTGTTIAIGSKISVSGSTTGVTILNAVRL